ncbi:hypothetical protein HanRHA438_Chr12g0554011 [Helianthus annuus]|nr:hypothetical protein HanRHA438_Chr12g0554011 [Helianthus annuus]
MMMMMIHTTTEAVKWVVLDSSAIEADFFSIFFFPLTEMNEEGGDENEGGVVLFCRKRRVW